MVCEASLEGGDGACREFLRDLSERAWGAPPRRLARVLLAFAEGRPGGCRRPWVETPRTVVAAVPSACQRAMREPSVGVVADLAVGASGHRARGSRRAAFERVRRVPSGSLLAPSSDPSWARPERVSGRVEEVVQSGREPAARGSRNVLSRSPRTSHRRSASGPVLGARQELLRTHATRCERSPCDAL